MHSGFLTPAQEEMLNNTPVVRLHVGLPSVRQIIEIPSGYAVHYSQLLGHYIQTGVMGRGSTLDIELFLSSPNVIGMLVFIFLTGAIGGWPSGNLTYPTRLSDDDSAHDPPMDDTPETEIELVFEVCRVGGSLLMNTDLVDCCAKQKLAKLLPEEGLPRNTITVEQAGQIFNRNYELRGMKMLVAKWFARNHAVESLKRERPSVERQEKGPQTELEGLCQANKAFAYAVDFYCDQILAKSRMAMDGSRLGKDLISGATFTLISGDVWKEIDEGSRFGVLE